MTHWRTRRNPGTYRVLSFPSILQQPGCSSISLPTFAARVLFPSAAEIVHKRAAVETEAGRYKPAYLGTSLPSLVASWGLHSRPSLAKRHHAIPNSLYSTRWDGWRGDCSTGSRRPSKRHGVIIRCPENAAPRAVVEGGLLHVSRISRHRG